MPDDADNRVFAIFGFRRFGVDLASISKKNRRQIDVNQKNENREHPNVWYVRCSAPRTSSICHHLGAYILCFIDSKVAVSINWATNLNGICQLSTALITFADNSVRFLQQ